MKKLNAIIVLFLLSIPTPTLASSPPSGQIMCKMGSNRLLVTGLAQGKKYYAMTEEDNSYSQANPNPQGYALFNNINYNDRWEGQSADLEVGYINPQKADFENRVPLGSMYVKKLNTIPP
ncbi:hypothetical protein [Aetokthonos hydrillicola]|nr:hypothetical protein [Aetokthonos hydrillicola]MBO3464264.1 hypothetical protein [Aetokthonos hydrillicola CCALA 1050]